MPGCVVRKTGERVGATAVTGGDIAGIDRPATRLDVALHAAGQQQILKHPHLPLAVAKQRLQTIQRADDVSEHRRRTGSLGFRAAYRWRGLEIEFGGIDVGDLGQPRTGRIKPDHVSLQLGNAPGQRAGIFFRLRAGQRQFLALLRKRFVPGAD